jgi:hypothetical protein
MLALWPFGYPGRRIPGAIKRYPSAGLLDDWEARQAMQSEAVDRVMEIEDVPLSEARLIVSPNRPGLLPDHN